MLPVVIGCVQHGLILISLACPLQQGRAAVKDAQHRRRRLVLDCEGSLLYLSNISRHHAPNKAGQFSRGRCLGYIVAFVRA